jgi:hypothetical protein
MKQPKIQGDVSNGQGKNSDNIWKAKAISRGQENIRLRKSLLEVKSSRELWKTKYHNLQNQPTPHSVLSGEKAARHQYSLALIALLLEFHKYGGMSLRSCRHCLGCLLVTLGLSSRIPSHSSIRNWLCKGGSHRISVGRETTGNYILYVDESIVFGSEKILLVIGVKQDNVPTTRALSHSDMEVLYVGASQEWKGEDIEVVLTQIALHKQINYVVSDEGHNLKKAYNSLNYKHIEDCTHILAKYLKKIYHDDADFETFRKLIGKLRRDWNLSKEKSKYVPPTMRGKMRFANIFPCVEWARNCLENWATLHKDVQSRLMFLREKETFIASLVEVSMVFKTICKTLKNQGFGTLQKQSILVALEGVKAEQRTSVFIENCKAYLDNLSEKSQALEQAHLLCSSDIIESFFGKFKTKIKANSRSGLTEFIFTIANFSQPFSVGEIKEALEKVKLKDLKLNKKPAKSP